MSPNIPFIVIMTFFSFQSLASKESKIRFQGGGSFFEATKSDTQFLFSDKEGPYRIEVKKCNKQVVDHVWSKWDKAAQSISKRDVLKKKSQTHKDSWVEKNGQMRPIYNFDAAYSTFLKARSDAYAAFVESERVCAGK